MENSIIVKDQNQAADNALTLSEDKFHQLPFEGKCTYLETLPPAERVELILEDQDDVKLARAMQPQQLYWLFKEVDAVDALELLGLASPLQCVFVLDMELWKGWSLLEDKAVEYLGYIMQGSEEHFLELLPHLDFNFLSLLLGREIVVAGGIGDLNTDEERLTDWDHTFDDVFLIKFRNPNHAKTVGAFLELVCRYDNPLYTALMESVSGEVDIELEEESYRMKSGRLADLGFPPHDEAIEIYSRINPATFVPAGGKALRQTGETITLPVAFLTGSTFLEKVLLLVDTDLFRMELNYLVNTALVADQAHLADAEQMKLIVERVYGYINIALEYLCRGDETKGAEILSGESLKNLFRLGFSIILELKFRAEKLTDSDYAADQALQGLKKHRPAYYLGFDYDVIDAYREFRDMQDVSIISAFLADLEAEQK